MNYACICFLFQPSISIETRYQNCARYASRRRNACRSSILIDQFLQHAALCTSISLYYTQLCICLSVHVMRSIHRDRPLFNMNTHNRVGWNESQKLGNQTQHRRRRRRASQRSKRPPDKRVTKFVILNSLLTHLTSFIMKLQYKLQGTLSTACDRSMGPRYFFKRAK